MGIVRKLALPLSTGIRDVDTSRALKQLEDIINGNSAIPVTGSLAGGGALKSLIAALVQLGLITDGTTT